MLTQLLTDAQALAAALPPMQTAIAAVQADIAEPDDVDVEKLEADAATLSTSVAAVETSITAVQADLASLPQAKDPKALQGAAAIMVENIRKASTHPILQELVCLSLPFLNAELESYGLPVIPLPAFCAAPGK